MKPSNYKFVSILGLPFFNETIEKCYEILSFQGGLLTVPSGPGLASITKDPQYYSALLSSDMLIADSGYMALVWNIISKKKIKRISGLAFINHFIKAYPHSSTSHSVFLVNPSIEEQLSNLEFYKSIDIKVEESDCYVAPHFKQGGIYDDLLLEKLKKIRPHWVFLNIGGGIQEILGSWLKENLDYKPAIICTGAAIAFKTGKQVDIPTWADKLYLGWLFRILSNPQKYYKRYLQALPLLFLLIKYRSKQVNI